MEKTNKYRFVDQCRLCDSSNLKPCFDFGDVSLGNNLAESREDALLADRYPLSVNRCVACGHLSAGSRCCPGEIVRNKLYLP